MNEHDSTITRVFISSSHADRDAAQKLRRFFESRRDFRVADASLVSAGGRWQEELRRLITSSDTFLLVTDREPPSDYVIQELGAAWALGKRLVHVGVPRRGDRLEWSSHIASVENITLRSLDDAEDLNTLADTLSQAAQPAAA